MDQSGPPSTADEPDSLRLAYRDLRERLGRYQTLIELSADWFWQKDENFRFVNLGVATEWPAGLPAMGEMLGRAGWEIPGFDMAGGWDAHRALLERHEGYRDAQVCYRRPDGDETLLSLSGTPTFDAQGRFTGYIGVARDVTESRRAQEEVARLNASLEQRVRERTGQLEAAHAELQAFAHAIAHDLRAPLTTIAGFSQLLERSLPAGADSNQARWLRRMAAGVQQMGVLTDALLSLASLAAATLQDEEVDLAELARTVVARLRRAEPDREAEVEIPEHLWVRGDPRLLVQVVTHLIDNAWKFSRRKPRTVIRMGSMPLAGEMAYFIADEGAGFDMAHAWRLFNGFQRLHTPAEFEGAGVGLALSHKIISRHGGRIWVQAAPDDGATFYFTLPPASA